MPSLKHRKSTSVSLWVFFFLPLTVLGVGVTCPQTPSEAESAGAPRPGPLRVDLPVRPHRRERVLQAEAPRPLPSNPLLPPLSRLHPSTYCDPGKGWTNAVKRAEGGWGAGGGEAGQRHGRRAERSLRQGAPSGASHWGRPAGMTKQRSYPVPPGSRTRGTRRSLGILLNPGHRQQTAQQRRVPGRCQAPFSVPEVACAHAH